MVCATVKKGYECNFMTKKGCSYNGGTCHPIVQNCEGCAKVITLEAGSYCQAFPDPKAKWRLGKCSMATHIKAEPAKAAAKTNPLKASKRASR